MNRLSRAEQNERNRALVLEAARRIFLARGYHAATLDEIADQAGFSRGVVQSRFGNKADLFLALLEEQIAERAAENARLAEGLSGAEGMRVLRERGARRNRAELDWGLLVIEFRVHAARDPDLSRRYAALHARTRQALAEVITGRPARSASSKRPGSMPARRRAWNGERSVAQASRARSRSRWWAASRPAPQGNRLMWSGSWVPNASP